MLRTSQVVLVAVIGFLAVSNDRAQETFTNVADTNTAGPAGYFTGFPDAPSIDGGTVAFYGKYGNYRGIFTGSGGALTSIVQENDPAPAPIGTFADFNAPSISAGMVAVLGFNSSAGVNQGVFTGNGGSLTTIAKTGSSAPTGGTFVQGGISSVSISSGTVAFIGVTGSTTGGVYTGSGGSLTTIVSSSSSAPTGTFTSFYSTSISGGTVAFSAIYGGSVGIFTGSGGPSTTIAKSGDAAPPGGTLRFFSIVSNSGSTVAFAAGYGVGNDYGIFTGNGGALTTIVKNGDPAPTGTFDITSLNTVSYSISGGTVAFLAPYDGGLDKGIFTSTGGVITPIIETGDSLFGSTVTALAFSETGLDENGDVAFSYTLADGVSGVAIAVPEPATLGLMGLAAAGLMGSRRRGR